MGLALVGAGLGASLGAFVVGLLAEAGGWRLAAGGGALEGVGVAIAAFTLIQGYPATGDEDDPSKVRVPGRRSPQRERLIPTGQYIRSPGLWRALVFLAFAAAGVLWVRSGLTVTGEWAVRELAGSESAVGLAQALFGVGITVGGLGGSVAADFWARRRLLWVGGVGAVGALAVASWFPSLGVLGFGAGLLVAALFLGGLGALIVLTFVDYMGVRLLGTLSVAFGLLAAVGRLPGPRSAEIVIEALAIQWWFLLAAALIALAVLLATRAPYPVIGSEEPATTAEGRVA